MLLAVQGCTAIFDGCKPLKMGAIRKPRFSDGDVEKAMDGFFNNLLDLPVRGSQSEPKAAPGVPGMGMNLPSEMSGSFWIKRLRIIPNLFTRRTLLSGRSTGR